MEFTFLYPQYLYGLFGVAFIVLIHFLTLKNKRHVAVKFANFDSIANIKGIDFYSKNLSLLVFSVIFVVLIVFSLSGLTVHYESEVSEYSFVLALDVSESMLASDISPNRLDAAKEEMISFVRNSPLGTEIGVLSFSGNAFIEQEVTDDKDRIIEAIERINVGQVSGTDVYEAILTASNMLYQEENKAVIILSDGQINVGNIDDAVDFVQERNIVVHSMALGTIEGGLTSYGLSQADYSSLESLSYNTKGVFMNVSSKDKFADYFSSVLSLREGEASLVLTPYLILATLIIFVVVYFFMNLHLKVLP